MPSKINRLMQYKIATTSSAKKSIVPDNTKLDQVQKSQ